MKLVLWVSVLLCVLTACAYPIGRHLDPWVGCSTQSLRFSWGPPTSKTDSTWTYKLSEDTVIWFVQNDHITGWQYHILRRNNETASRR